MRVAAVVLVFVLLGPPVGGVTFMLAAVVVGLGSAADLQGLSWVLMFALIYAVPLSYLAGTIPAVIAGLLMGIRQAYFGPATWPYAVGIGLIVGFGMLYLSGQRLGPGADAPVPILLATCLVPTLVCWLVVRGWHFAHTLAGRIA
jgi:hypothetical protein